MTLCLLQLSVWRRLSCSTPSIHTSKPSLCFHQQQHPNRKQESLHSRWVSSSNPVPLNSWGLGNKQRALHIACSSRSKAGRVPWPESLRPVLLLLGLWPKADAFEKMFLHPPPPALRSGQLLQVCPAGGFPLLVFPRSPWKVWLFPSNQDLKALIIFKCPFRWSFTA